jgi:2-polyprenyl-3-methyl-5-hydroxy-6-metoxy-1,4-benzoquinol methylase
MNDNRLKGEYAKAQAVATPKTFFLNKRLFNTYNRISTKLVGKQLKGVNLDLGCGDGGFSQVCMEAGIQSIGLDYPESNLEKDRFQFDNASIDFVTLNAVIEHIANPSNLLGETNRVLRNGGLIFIRTPNWKMDYKNFFNDPTHVKPYSPESLQRALELHGFNTIFKEPGLIEKRWFWWELPDKIKWQAAKRLPGGTKSILAVGQKI